jgi:excisionase family DNA binding protein
MAQKTPTCSVLVPVRRLLESMSISVDAKTPQEGFDEARRLAVGIIDAAMAAEGVPRLLNISQARARAGVSRRTIYNWINSGRIEWVRTAGGAIRIVEASLWRPGRRA